MIRVVLVDDQLLLRESIAHLLENDDLIEVVAMGANGNDAIKLCAAYNPDIILTTFENPDNIMESFANDADGYVVKNISHKDLVRAIKCVNNGLTVIDKSVKKIMMDRFKGLTDYKSKYEDILTEREINIVKYIAVGLSNKEIAAELSYSQGTIKNNVSKILEKLNMSDRIQIAIFAIENGMV